jgi:hypothetical protein
LASFVIFRLNKFPLADVIASNYTFAAMLKRLITIFLLCVMAIQMLPIQQMGAALFSNQFTEELPHGVDVEKDDLNKMQGKSEFIEWFNAPIQAFISTQQTQHTPLAVTIPHNHSAEMLVPPPNCI